MICYNCGKCVLPKEIATVTFNDKEGNILEKKLLCYVCAKKFALALLKARENE